jgi:bis(5'-nucleosyl)-tetraphosphatase (symmetrical)
VIVNAMTRMRFCSPAGVMEFKTKGELAGGAWKNLPWFEVPGGSVPMTLLVIGHWSALGLRSSPTCWRSIPVVSGAAT